MKETSFGPRRDGNERRVTVLCPVFNEERCIAPFYERLRAALASCGDRYEFELLFSNNCSTDGTLGEILKLREKDRSVQVVTLSRNFGYEKNLVAGLEHVQSDAVVIIDVDCEDPPEMIPAFLAGWEEGHDVVYGIRASRPEPRPIQWARKAFYRLTRAIADYDFVLDMAEFSLFTERVRRQVLANRSTYPFIRAELGSVGFSMKGIRYARQRRIAGTTHYNLWRMFEFAVGGMLSSSTFPLRFVSWLGFPLALLTVLATIGLAVGSSELRMLDLLLLANLTFLIVSFSFVSIYVARIYKDGVGKPIFIVDEDASHLNRERQRPAA